MSSRRRGSPEASIWYLVLGIWLGTARHSELAIKLRACSQILNTKYCSAMQSFTTTAETVAATTKKTEKVRLVADYFLARPVDDAAQAALFLSGRAFPAWEERTLQIGGT